MDHVSENHTDVVPGTGTPVRPARTRSYSQISQWLDCPRQFQLSRIVRVPRKPGWWFPGGTAVHATVEAYLRASLEART